MCCTGGEARSNAKACGWVDKALEEGIIVLAPNYNNYATYSETAGIVSAVEYAIHTYPVDASRVYATGFSNGGAVSVALSSEYPQLFAAISSYGWMVDMRNQHNAYDMPFQVIQGTKEYTYATSSGAMAIMQDEQKAIRSLFLFNEMTDESVQADYDETPYWGYVPDDMHSDTFKGHEWQFNNFYKDGYTTPFAQFVLIDGAKHQPNEHEATVAWDFFKNYSRGKDGSVIEIK
jgi:poly(3-hydroxybutyrate) depolymerase